MDSRQVLKEGTLEADVVVIGGGGTGLAAALSAAENGASVVLLEKQAIGGNSAIAMGILAADSLVQKSQNIVALPDDVVRIALEYSHWKIDQRLFRTFVNKSADTIQWLEDKGLSFQVAHCYPGQEPLTWHLPDGYGAAVVRVLRKECEDRGVRLLTHCPVTKILTGEHGEVTGVLATMNGEELRVSAKTAIIATGGYGGNKDLLKKYFPTYNENMECTGIKLMGDGLPLAMEVGAATEGLGNLMLHPHVYPGPKKFYLIVRDPRGLWVSKKGERFTDEGIGLRPPECGSVVNRQPDKCVYVLWDSGIKDLVACERRGKHPLQATRGVPAPELADLDEDLRVEAEKGGILISESWGEIARWMGIAREVLNATVDEYNFSCDKGHDEAFAKDRRYLRALRTPPYYAIRCYLAFLTTVGGIKINHHMEVLDTADTPIPGLYAGGDTTGGWESETYNMVLAGSAFGFAINSGRIAGENAAKLASRG